MLTRRMVFAGAAGLMTRPAPASDDVLSRLEGDGRLGVAALDTGSGKTLRHRAGERFAMCSTFKLLLAAAVLQRIDVGTEDRNRKVTYSKSGLVAWSPITERQAGAEYGMSVGGLIDAILLYSDNTAANLLLDTISGPAGWTAFARSLGDTVSRLDRMETALNSTIPGDNRDTTTPEAMLADLQRVLVGAMLAPTSRQFLIDTMAQSTTGAHRLKAGLPDGWRIASKTGSGEHGTCNDIGIIFPPGRAPILVCAYFTGSTHADKEAVLAGVGRIIAEER